jgi:hypothetical protein
MHKNGLVRLAFGTQFTSVDRNRRVQAKHSIPWQQARALDTDAGNDMLCRGDVVAVVLEVGNRHDLSACAVLGILLGMDQPFEVTDRGMHNRNP